MSKAPHRYSISGYTFEARSLPPGLYLVATPIGNLGDVTLRALETLASADLVYCEDTRITSRLLNRYGIAKPLKPYHDHNAAKVRPALLDALRGGASVALLSDAGTPLVSDPGYKLVLAATSENIHVDMIPGPSAPLAALTLSGLPVDRFLFAGFLPSRRTEKQRVLQELESVPATLIFFEAPARISETMELIRAVLGNRRVALARELTKLHQEILRGSAEDLIALVASRGRLKGEITVVVEPPSAEKKADPAEIDAALDAALELHSPAKAASLLARKFAIPRQDLYDLAVGRKMSRRDKADE